MQIRVLVGRYCESNDYRSIALVHVECIYIYKHLKMKKKDERFESTLSKTIMVINIQFKGQSF